MNETKRPTDIDVLNKYENRDDYKVYVDVVPEATSIGTMTDAEAIEAVTERSKLQLKHTLGFDIPVTVIIADTADEDKIAIITVVHLTEEFKEAFRKQHRAQPPTNNKE